jgi:ABC-type multidrug transport system fused ATPase/permease subunit
VTSTVTAEIGTILRTLPSRRRRELVLISLLMPATAVAEMVMVTAVVPVLAILGGTNSNLPMLQLMLGWIDRISPGSPLAAAAILFVAAAFATAVLRLILSWMTLQFSAQVGHDLNLAIQDRLLHQPYLFHVSSNSSRLLASLEKVDFLALDLTQRGLQAIGAAIISVAVIAALLRVDPVSAAAAAFLVALLYGLVSLLFRRRLDACTALTVRAYERRIQLVQESHGGIRDIIINRSQPTHLAAFAAIDDPFMRARAEAMFLSGAPRYLVEGLGFGLIALLGLFFATRPGGLPAALPVLGALVLGAQRLLPLSSQIYNAWFGFASSGPILREVAALLRLPIEQPVGQLAELPFRTSITFQDVGLRYSDRSSVAISGLSFTIPHGARVAIVGKTGAGKSTLADLIMGLIEPTEGQIWIDGTRLDGSTLAAWRKSIAHVPQSIFLTDTTISRNIALVPPNEEPDVARVKHAASAAQLDRFIATLPDGYDTVVGERGAKLSGGQRQRLALARAIYRQSPLLVLDEATSALDDATEAAVLSSLDQLNAAGVTIVIVAHRLSTVERCDLVLMLDDGRLAQSGTAQEMLGKLKGMKQ